MLRAPDPRGTRREMMMGQPRLELLVELLLPSRDVQPELPPELELSSGNIELQSPPEIPRRAKTMAKAIPPADNSSISL